jgi:hypothetical protein
MATEAFADQVARASQAPPSYARDSYGDPVAEGSESTGESLERQRLTEFEKKRLRCDEVEAKCDLARFD